MAVIKCKMCGGDLNIVAGESVCECEYCGTRQTIPSADNEKKLTLFARANRLRLASEFDKAFSIYESIVADFPEEAEAYWGLVLCKYGIEYVDDPATGKKIPTCHRSSFDSVMEDSDFEQACENADGTARRVYREEAKQIEEIRKGILEVSGREEPYDLFICYKETDENGDRTLDSVLAQDIYDALTEKGYRVFFSRITLEDKLGQEYEPYIFAALNSAKIMLAVGTDYEYYNAVWVKNEWSRYLKLMAKDKDKHLIPCYKNLDAYDMPEEFAKLQAQDLGKVGATQDLLRGIEKLLPRKKPEVRETVVLQQTNGSHTDALLKRGYMALEDREWKQASDFFEEVLNQNAECARAYLGKVLAAEKASNLQKLISIRLNTDNADPTILTLPEDRTHIDASIAKYKVPDYLPESKLSKLYNFNLQYSSHVQTREVKRAWEESYWKSHRNMNRALQFADPELMAEIQKFLADIYQKMDQHIQKAKRDEADAKLHLEEEYAAFLKRADQKAEELQKRAILQKTKDDEAHAERQRRVEEEKKRKYDSLCKVYSESEDVKELRNAAAELTKLGDYYESKVYSAKCTEKADRIEAAERQRHEETALKAQKDKAARKKVKIVVLACLLIAVTIVAVIVKIVIPIQKYSEAKELYNIGEYSNALDLFQTIAGFKDSDGYILEIRSKLVDKKVISTDVEHRVGILKDGSVVASGSDFYGQCEVSDWRNIVDIDTGFNYTVGLREDGTVIATGENDFGQCNVENWENIISISAGGKHTVGLTANGKAIAVGDNMSGQCNVEAWSDLMAVSAGKFFTVGLRRDGTVVAAGDNENGQCDVDNWKNIVSISAGYDFTMGLCADGTVVTAGLDGDIEQEISAWRNITAISAGRQLALGREKMEM